MRIGDKLSDQLTIPKEYKGKIKDVKKYCTKPELEMLLIISEGLNADFEKEKSKKSPKIFSKEHIVYHRTRYDNSTDFYRNYYGDRIDLLVDAIKRYKPAVLVIYQELNYGYGGWMNVPMVVTGKAPRFKRGKFLFCDCAGRLVICGTPDHL